MNHVIVADLGYGDSGKGSVVSWLCDAGRGAVLTGPAPVRAVVRFNGGAQAAHNVVTADGRHHTFAQFGSGTFTPGVRTHLSRFMLVDPLALAAEADHLTRLGVGSPFGLLSVDRDALAITPYHQAANRARKRARGVARHGSCGMGIGETARFALAHPGDAPRVADCAAPRTLERKLARRRDALTAELGPLDAPPIPDVADAFGAFAARVALVDGRYLHRLLRTGPVVFEGAQGVLLDEWRGFHPYTTWSTTTFANAETLLAEAGQTGLRLGVTRTYLTRHGPGPLVTEDPTLEIREPHNSYGRWQGAFRTGHLDAVALRYAVEVPGGVDMVALTHLDTAARHRLRLGGAYEVDGQRLDHLVPAAHDLAAQESLTRMLLRARPVYSEPGADWPGIVEATTGAPVALRSWGPAAADKVATVPATRAPAGLPEQLLHLAEPWMLGVTQPFEQHHLRGHDLGAVLAGPVQGGIPVGRVAGADGVRDHGHPAPGGQQGKHGLQHADVRLDPRDQDLAGPRRQQGGETRIPGGRETGFVQGLGGVFGQLRHGGAQPGRILLGGADGHVQHPRCLGQPGGPGDDDLAVMDGGHKPLLQVDEQQDRTLGVEQHITDVTP